MDHLGGDTTTLVLVRVERVSGENFSTLKATATEDGSTKPRNFVSAKPQKPQTFPTIPRLKCCCTSYVGVVCPRFCSCWRAANAKPGRLAALMQ